MVVSLPKLHTGGMINQTSFYTNINRLSNRTALHIMGVSLTIQQPELAAGLCNLQQIDWATIFSPLRLNMRSVWN